MRGAKLGLLVAAILLAGSVPAHAALTPRSLSLTLSAPAYKSEPVSFTGTLSNSPEGTVVTLQVQSGTAWTAVTTATTDVTGSYSENFTPTKTGTFTYRAHVAKTPTLAVANSPTSTRTILKRVTVTLAASDLGPPADTPVELSGQVTPWVPGTSVELRKRNGTTGPFTSAALPVAANGTFSKFLTIKANKSKQYRVVVAQRGNYSGAKSADVTISTAGPSISTTSLPDGIKDSAYAATVQVADGRPGTWAVISGTPPTGLTLNPATGELTGTPTATGSSIFTVQFTDLSNRLDDVEFSVQIDTGSLPNPPKVQMTAGQDDVCRVKTDGTLQCWGHNWAGELGIGPTPGNEKRTPTTVGTGWASVSSGLYDHTCGVKTDYSLWCWGRGDDGQLGNGQTVWYDTPQQAGAGLHFRQVNAGYHHSCGIRTDNTLWCWGAGVGGTTVTQVIPGTTWKQVDAAQGYTCAIKSDNTLWCWGSNFRGWLGVGDTTDRPAPTEVANGGTWKLVTAGQGHTCGLKTDDTLWCWGKNSKGNLGDDTVTDRTSPTAVVVSGLQPDTWTTASASGMGNQDHTCGVGSDGTIWCWGTNFTGELGDGATTDTAPHKLPQSVGSATDWESVASGATHSCAVKTDSTTWCWGSNANGQIGQNNFIGQYLSPTQVN